MKSDKPEQTDFVLLGTYAPREAVKLLARFKAAGIPYRIQPRKPSPQTMTHLSFVTTTTFNQPMKSTALVDFV